MGNVHYNMGLLIGYLRNTVNPEWVDKLAEEVNEELVTWKEPIRYGRSPAETAMEGTEQFKKLLNDSDAWDPLAVKKKRKKGKNCWTDQEEEIFLTMAAAKNTAKEIAAALPNRTYAAVGYRLTMHRRK